MNFGRTTPQPGIGQQERQYFEEGRRVKRIGRKYDVEEVRPANQQWARILAELKKEAHRG